MPSTHAITGGAVGLCVLWWRPLLGALVLTWWLGAYALVFGIAMLVAAFQLRSRSQEQPSTGGAAHPSR